MCDLCCILLLTLLLYNITILLFRCYFINIMHNYMICYSVLLLVFVIWLLVHYCVLLHDLLLCILTFFVITLLLYYYYTIIIIYSLLPFITIAFLCHFHIIIT